MKEIIQIIGILFIGLNLSGQSVWIDSLYANQNSLTIDDTVRIIGEIRTASAGCDLVSTELQIDELNKIIEITACYAIGPLDTICPSVDTFLIGQLEEGEYQVILTGKGFETITNPSGDCLNSWNGNSKEIEIFVSGINSTKAKSEYQINFGLIKNPVREIAVFSINSDLREVDVVITDNLGRLIVRKSIMNDNRGEIKLDVGHFPSGIYYCYFENEVRMSKAVKMIKK